MFICFDVIHERDGRTDGRMDRQTLRDSKDCAYASHRAVKNHPVYESALALAMGGGSSVPRGALCQIKVAQVLVGRGQARIFFVPLMLFLERLEG